ncbi:GNAT family N-acetyltransferase [Alteromonas flava]|uniref:GNAT family N-acetyltransferase n=1 Tax=Alteromonas flava TaxID=2048003 RepID=UPI000C28B42D|nr:GNAT family N-acetyltransferase [Alteromonas flava]
MLNNPVQLRQLTSADAEFIFRLVTDPAWLHFIGDRGVRDIESAKAFIETRIQPVYAKDGLGLYGITKENDGKLLGLCGLLQRDFLPAPDLGFALLPESRGLGLAHAASKRVLQRAQAQGLTTIYAFTAPENHASQALLTRLGFTREADIAPQDQLSYLFRKSLSELS